MGKHAAKIRTLRSWRKYLAVASLILTAGSWVPAFVWTEATSDDDVPQYQGPLPPVVGDHATDPWAKPAPTKKVDKILPKPTHTTTAPKPKPKNKATTSKPTDSKKTPQHPVKPNPVPTRKSSIIASFLRAQLGKPYVWGGNGPYSYDCSGLTVAAYKKVGIDLPRTSQEQSTRGRRVSLHDLRVGDLLFWGGVGTAHHVAIYVGNGHYIAAQNPRQGVIQGRLADYPPSFARRVL